MPDIVISEDIQGPAVDELCLRYDVLRAPDLWTREQHLAEFVRFARALIVRNQTKVTKAIIQAGEKLVVIGRAGAGLDNIDVKAATDAGVVVSYTPDQNSISAAEHTVALMLSLVRQIPQAHLDTQRGEWNRSRFVGVELYGKTLGIIGAGKIGFITARRAQAFGMKVLVYDPFIGPDNVYLAELSPEFVTLDELLRRSDVVSCHVPATAETTGLLDRQRLSMMKRTAYLINTSRGEVIDEPDLIDALKTGIIAGAALDVRTSEPPHKCELETMPNVIVTPHIAAFTREAQERVTKAVCDDVARVLEGKPGRNAATPFNLPRAPSSQLAAR